MDNVDNIVRLTKNAPSIKKLFDLEFENFKIADVFNFKLKRDLIVIDSETTIGEALKILHSKSIRSIPIVSKEDSKKYLGSINVLDIAG